MTVDGFVTAMAPAFAAGFAVQRLLEILDPLINQWIGEARKRIALGLISFFLGLAFATKFKVLAALGGGADTPSWLVDYLVTGLIISGGTEGFNSILKFLSYKKEEVKAVTEGDDLLPSNTEIVVSHRLPSTVGRSSLTNLLATSFGGSVVMDVDAQLKAELKTGLKLRWKDKFIETKWEKLPFKEYSENLDAHKETVLEATIAVAATLGLTLPKKIKNNLQDLVSLDSTPEAVIPFMSEAIDWAVED